MTMVWSLTRVLGLPAAFAAGTLLPTQLAGNSVAAATLASSGCVDPTAALLIAVPGALSAVVGARVSKFLPDAALQLIISGALVATGPALLKRALAADGSPRAATRATTHAHTPPVECRLDLAAASAWLRAATAELLHTDSLLAARHGAAGLAMGFCVGALGIGTGPVCMTCIHHFAICTDTPQAEALGTTNCAMLPALLAGSLTHMLAGRTQLRLLPTLCAGTILGSGLGASLAVRAPESWLQGALGVGLVVAGGNSARAALRRLL